MTYPTSYTEADSILTGRCKDRRKVDNNTYAERRTDGSIAIRLHATDVVTFRQDGSTVLESGGWLTVTTKDRINNALGNRAAVFSVKGRWYISPRNGWRVDHDAKVPYVDGMVILSDGSMQGGFPSTVAREDAANKAMQRDVAKFVKGITPEAIVDAWENTGGDCFLCRADMGTHCLASHVEEGYFHATLAHRAITAAGYPNPSLIMSMVYSNAKNRGEVDSLLTRSLRKYLRKNLTVGAVATA